MNPRPVSYLQTDPRWGSLDYSARGEKTNIAVSGCGPTALAMVLATWVDPKITPKSECAWALPTATRPRIRGPITAISPRRPNASV